MFNMRTACDTAHVKSVLWLLLNMLQHVLGNNLQFNSRARQVVNKETPPHWILLPKTCCRMFRRSRSTDFTCAVSQAVRILNICKTFHGIQVPLNFLFKFTEINLVVVNINLVNFIWFDYVVSVIFTCQMMSNFLKHFTGTIALMYREFIQVRSHLSKVFSKFSECFCLKGSCIDKSEINLSRKEHF